MNSDWLSMSEHLTFVSVMQLCIFMHAFLTWFNYKLGANTGHRRQTECCVLKVHWWRGSCRIHSKEFLMLQSDNFTIVQDELEEEILFQGLWGQIQVVIGMLQSSLAQSQVQFSWSCHEHNMYIISVSPSLGTSKHSHSFNSCMCGPSDHLMVWTL